MSGLESVVEQAAIDWLGQLGYAHVRGPDLGPDGPSPERASYADTVLAGRLRAALARLNPHLDADTLDSVLRRVLRPASPCLEESNLAVHRLLTKGAPVEVRREGGVRGDLAWLIDFARPERNDWLVVSQLTVRDGKHTRRADLVVYVNGLPLGLIELKSPEDQQATLKSAWNQLQTYKAEVPALFHANELCVVSDGAEARVGSLTAGFERFAPWRTVDGCGLAPEAVPKLEVLLRGLFEPRRFLDYVRSFVLWDTDGGYAKKIAGYHQFHAVAKAVRATVRASRPEGDQRIGVVWHTQGSGKSISMVFYAAKLMVEPALANPTIVVITDRNDLDGQLYGEFCRAKDLLPAPEQAQSREHLKALLQVASGGIVFTTIQKFGSATKGERFPLLSERRNLVVVADEAHRSQYAFIEGFARNLRDALPHASFVGFTGTPIELDDRSTPAVFGDYIDTYTIRQAVEDRATVPIFYEARLARIALPEDKRPRLDEEFEEITEGEEEATKGELKSRWARLEAMVGTEERLALVACDIVEHWERRLAILDGKAMIVAMSRRIAVDLYAAIVKLRPAWHAEGPEQGVIKVVMTGSASDPPAFRPHLHGRSDLKTIERRFKDPADPLRLVIVRDMWLTGFDAPSAHTLYADKPMRGHGLMQAIARVNRVYKDKPAGLVVDYLGLAEQLRRAVGQYGGERGVPGEPPAVPVETALAVLVEKLEVVKALFHGFDYQGYLGQDPKARLAALTGGANHICGLADGRDRFLAAMTKLDQAAGIAIHLEAARPLRDEVGYFQAVRGSLRKHTVGKGGQADEELDLAIRQLVSSAVASEGVVDIFGAAGLARPDLSILSDAFLETVRTSPHRNLQLEVLKKLLHDEVRAIGKRNVVQARRFSEMLAKTLTAYQNRTIEAAQVILELIALAKELREAPRRGAGLGLSDDELCFYDALADHGDVRQVMGDAALAAIAHDLVDAIRGSVTIDWTAKEAVRADLRRQVKRLLRKHGYPPDQQEAAVVTVIEQAETLCRDWAESAPAAAPARSPATTEPFRRLPLAEVRPFENALPLCDLRVAAGLPSAEQRIDELVEGGSEAAARDPGRLTWVALEGARVAPAPGLFVARVTGESMNRRIPNGAWCVFRMHPGGARGGKVVVARHESIADPDLGRYTIKVYDSEKRSPDGVEDGAWRHQRVTLRPDSWDPRFEPIVLDDLVEGELRIVAELVEVLGR